MYNGIGLATVRGSGTNGYVTKNMAFVSASRAAERKDRTEGFKRDIPQPKQPDQDIIEHNRKRDVEVKVLRLRESLEDKGVDEAEIEAKTAELRKSLLNKLPTPAAKRPKAANEEAEARGSMETHARAAAKETETKALKSALGIDPGYVAGSAFDRELQQKKRVCLTGLQPQPSRLEVDLPLTRASPALDRTNGRSSARRRRVRSPSWRHAAPRPATHRPAPTLQKSRAHCPCPSFPPLIPRHRPRPSLPARPPRPPPPRAAPAS